MSSFIPKRLVHKVTIMNGDGLSDDTFVASLGGKMNLKQLYASRVGLCTGVSDEFVGEQEILAGGTFEKFYDVSAGQRIQWKFELVTGAGDSWFGASDIEF